MSESTAETVARLEGEVAELRALVDSMALWPAIRALWLGLVGAPAPVSAIDPTADDTRRRVDSQAWLTGAAIRERSFR